MTKCETSKTYVILLSSLKYIGTSFFILQITIDHKKNLFILMSLYSKYIASYSKNRNDNFFIEYFTFK